MALTMNERDEGNPNFSQAKPKPTPNLGLIQQSPAKLEPKKILGFPLPN
jgi:hypothetical protein